MSWRLDWREKLENKIREAREKMHMMREKLDERELNREKVEMD